MFVLRLTTEQSSLFCLALIISFTKLLMLRTYRSTDYEVHRNWLAITHSLHLSKWYTDATSEWTLDYPPFFAWFEFTLSQFARWFDLDMLKVTNLNHVSEMSVLFQKLSVIVSDFLFLYAAYRFVLACVPSQNTNSGTWVSNPRIVVAVLLMYNFGLFIIDHIHFQYNGFLYGILLLSITAMFQGRHVTAALHFATLINFKHIYLYMAPAYGIYLLRVYCFKSSAKDGSVLWTSFSWRNFSALGITVMAVCCLSFGPFIYMGQLSQVISRLFPFKRGLCHAYWAPNFWALYNMADKGLYLAGRKLDVVEVSNHTASMTGGLVQEFEHVVLPTVKPLATFILTVLFMMPSVLHLWMNPSGPRSFLKCAILCAFTSCMFGWHVHEKAILMVVLPLALLSQDSSVYGRHFLHISVLANLSLFPLIYTPFEQPLLIFGMLAYTLYTWRAVSQPELTKEKRHVAGTAGVPLTVYEKIYVTGLAVVMVFYMSGHMIFPFIDRYPFLPLLLISVYLALGVTICYLSLYKTVLSESMVIKLKKK